MSGTNMAGAGPTGFWANLLRGFSWCLMLTGAVALCYTSYVTGLAHGYQDGGLAALVNSASAASAEQGASHALHRGAVVPMPPDGQVVGELIVPRLRMKIVVEQGYSREILRRAVGHIPGTSLPGQPGNVVLAGHRDTFFRPLRDIRAGDLITLSTGHGKFQYQVQSTVVVAPSHVEVLRPSSGNMLTLITCFPFYYVGAAPNRFVVRARQVDALPEARLDTMAAHAAFLPDLPD